MLGSLRSSTVVLGGAIPSLALWIAVVTAETAHSSVERTQHETNHQHEGDRLDHAGGDHHEGAADHVHPPVPDDYRSAHVPASVWTDPGMIARGREIYGVRCAVCHGDRGDGRGPAAGALPLKPPDLRDARMVNAMRGSYWFWRVSEGGQVEPFRSQGSAMPAWKDVLSVEDRWAVIAYQHAFSGHRGPHVTSEHPEMALPDSADASP
jgi:mono/diheme cytochrome c family protein